MDPMKQKRDELDKLNAELLAFQEKCKGGEYKPTPKEAEAMDGKADESLALQEELDTHVSRSTKLQRALDWKPANLTLPPDNQPKPTDKVVQHKIEGFMRVGEYVMALGGLDKFNAAGRPNIKYELAKIPHLLANRREREPLVPLTGKQVAELAQMQTKAVPTIGAGIIDPMRVPDIVRVTEMDQLVLRDVLNIGQTNSNSVEWVREVSYTRAAEPTAHGAEKPEAAKVFDLVSSPVRTIAGAGSTARRLARAAGADRLEPPLRSREKARGVGHVGRRDWPQLPRLFPGSARVGDGPDECRRPGSRRWPGLHAG